jgi:gluconolactonase
MDSFFGRRFGCICAVVAEIDAAPGIVGLAKPAETTDVVWFVDAGDRGLEAGSRPKSELPAMVWRYDLTSGDLRAMTDQVRSPRGIALSPDNTTLYISDCDPDKESGTAPGAGLRSFDHARYVSSAHSSARQSWSRTLTDVCYLSSGSIYAFDVTSRFQTLFLTGRRLFARALCGIPHGLLCDDHGNVFAGCGDGSRYGTGVGRCLV